MDPLLNHPCVRRGFRRISAGGFKIDYCYSTWSALEEAPPSWCCWWWCRTMRGPFSVFFSSPYRGLLVSGQSSRSLSVAARSMLRPHVASFPLTMLHLSLILTLLPFPLGSRRSVSPFSSSDCKCSSCLAPRRLVMSQLQVWEKQRSALFGKDRSVGEASAAIYRLPSNYQIPH